MQDHTLVPGGDRNGNGDGPGDDVCNCYSGSNGASDGDTGESTDRI
jgi:hypothetical protein